MTASSEVVNEPGWVDTHAHLQDPALRDDLDAIFARASQAGVSQIIAVGITADDSAEVARIARCHRGVFAAVGVQPNSVAQAGQGDMTRIAALADGPEVVALGETGLDRYWDHTPLVMQQEWFDRHLTLAVERSLPVVIHCRDCERDIVDQLERFGHPIRGVIHSFTGNWDDAQAFLDLGLYLSFAGMVTFSNKRLDPLREASTHVPLDRLLIETDCPYLSPTPYRGKTNEPARVTLTAAFIASLRGISAKDLARATTRNAGDLFRLPPNISL